MFKKLWNDESGIVGLEYLVLATLIALALIAGANQFGVALNSEFSELSNSVVQLNQSFRYVGYSNCVAQVNGAGALGADTAGTVSGTIVVPTVAALITVNNCAITTP